MKVLKLTWDELKTLVALVEASATLKPMRNIPSEWVINSSGSSFQWDSYGVTIKIKGAHKANGQNKLNTST